LSSAQLIIIEGITAEVHKTHTSQERVKLNNSTIASTYCDVNSLYKIFTLFMFIDIKYLHATHYIGKFGSLWR